MLAHFFTSYSSQLSTYRIPRCSGALIYHLLSRTRRCQRTIAFGNSLAQESPHGAGALLYQLYRSQLSTHRIPRLSFIGYTVEDEALGSAAGHDEPERIDNGVEAVDADGDEHGRRGRRHHVLTEPDESV